MNPEIQNSQNQNTNQQPPKSSSPQTQVPPNQSVDIPIDLPPPGSPIKKILIIGGIIIGLILLVVAGIYAARYILQPSESQDIELTYWGIWDEKEIFEDVITEFEKENPNITINYELIDVVELGDTVTRLQTRIDNGEGPDVFRFHSSWVPQLVTPSVSYLKPLDEDTLKSTGLEEEYFDVIKKDMKLGNAYYGIPLFIDTLSLFVNEESFKESGSEYPTDWFEFLDRAKEFTIQTGEGSDRKIISPGAALGTYDNVEHAPDIISLFLLQSGVTQESILQDRADEAIIGLLNYYTCFAKSVDGCQPVWNTDMPNSKQAFASGLLPMYFGYSYDLLEINNANPELPLKILKVPRLEENGITIASYWAEGISAKTKHPEASLKFLAYLSKKESLQQIFSNQSKARRFASPYPRNDMAQLLKSNDLLYPFVEQAEQASSSIFYSNTFDGGRNERLNNALNQAITGIIEDSISVESASETLVNQIKQIINPQAESDE